MKDSHIVYILWVIGILLFGPIGIVLFIIAIYFSDRVKKKENEKFGNKLMWISLVLFIILIVVSFAFSLMKAQSLLNLLANQQVPT
ncbi:MAG: hypothetical protein HY518_05180 [Candidatus Aenigmarchaeota archaeon]|nr:hypothetical protein [Candidatus Aenigmarchaeota archaeon]